MCVWGLFCLIRLIDNACPFFFSFFKFFISPTLEGQTCREFVITKYKILIMMLSLLHCMNIRQHKRIYRERERETRKVVETTAKINKVVLVIN